MKKLDQKLPEEVDIKRRTKKAFTKQLLRKLCDRYLRKKGALSGRSRASTAFRIKRVMFYLQTKQMTMIIFLKIHSGAAA